MASPHPVFSGAPRQPEAKTVYDLLRALVRATGWHSEAEEVAYLKAIESAERLRVFGNSAEDLDI